MSDGKIPDDGPALDALKQQYVGDLCKGDEADLWRAQITTKVEASPSDA